MDPIQSLNPSATARCGSAGLLIQHQKVHITDILLQLRERCPLAEHARNVRQPTDKPVAVFPILHSKKHRHPPAR